MSQHNSLRVDSVGVKHRNVLTRLERVKKMQSEERWNESSKIFGLPKIKSMKMKVKKAKEAPAAEDAAKAGAPALPAAGKAAPAAKAAAPAAKGAAAKPAGKK